LSAGEATALASGQGRARPDFTSVCQFPGEAAERQRLVVAAVDSLRAETAFDPNTMPWLSAHRKQALWGRMQPCVSQLSLLCFRTMFEGAEPLLVTGFNNYTGMNVASDNLIERLARRGIRVAAVADRAFVSLYAESLAVQAEFEQRPREIASRDAFGRAKTFEWLADPALDVIVTHVIDTDATAHRVGIGHPQYVAKFRETDDFLKAIQERLGPNDSLIVLGDHGHDAHGYHSTGIPSDTAYFASGPLFPRGLEHDTRMATTSFLMGAVTCEPVSDNYQGTFPSSALLLPGPYLELQRKVESQHAPVESRAGVSPVRWELPAVAILFAVVSLLVRAIRDPGSQAARSGVLSSLTLLPSLVFPHPALLWLAALSVGSRARRFLTGSGRLLWVVAGAFAIAASVGASAHLGLVTLQNHVNPRWTVGFWCALALVIGIAGWVIARTTRLALRHALGVAAASSMLLLLAFGPYYYGTARNLLYGTTWLLLSHTLELVRRDRKLVGLLALAILPLLPLYAPVLKEWQPTYPLIEWFGSAGTGQRLALALVAFVPLAIATPDRKRRLRLALILAGFTALSLLTDLGPIPWLNTTLLLLSYVGFMAAAQRAEQQLASPSARRFLVPLGQASYGFMAFFVLLGALRFANVDYRFALALTPVELGEGRAALVALPIVTAKYVLPICLLLLSGPALRLESLWLILVKAGCLAAGLIGFELSEREAARLFLELQTQETALVAVLYMTLLGLFGLSRLSPRTAEADSRAAGPAFRPRDQAQDRGQHQHAAQHAADLADGRGDAKAADRAVDRQSQ
jgi:hypothetical protein